MGRSVRLILPTIYQCWAQLDSEYGEGKGNGATSRIYSKG